MSDDPKTPKRKAWRKRSPKQVAFLEGKAERDKAKAERDRIERADAWWLNAFHPELAKAKRLKGVEKNKSESAWRRQKFVKSFADWPAVLPAGEMGERIREWLRDRTVLTPKNQRRTWKWRGCEKNFVKTEVSVRKKLTKLGVFRFNFRLGVWFKCGSVEEAVQEAKAREEAEKLVKAERQAREEAHQAEAERQRLEWVAIRDRERLAKQEADRAKQEAEKLERVLGSSKPFGAGWYDAIPDELRPTVVFLWGVQSLDEAPTWRVEGYKSNPEGWHKYWQASREKQAKAVEGWFASGKDAEQRAKAYCEAISGVA
jgi:hypothetical protein